MAYRFYIEQIPDQATAVLAGEQAHHASQVMRFKAGDEIVLFDGTGTEAACRITEVNKKRLTLEILQRQQICRSLSCSITIAVALPKSDRQKFLVEKLVELGVDRLIPLRVQRNVAAFNDKVTARINKQIIEASKQCRRNRLMQLLPSMDFTAVHQHVNTHDPSGSQAWIADPYEGVPIGDLNRTGVSSDMKSPASTKGQLIAIGPEGGFTEREVQTALDLGFQKLRMGPAVLRIETAAIAAAAILGIGQERK